MASILVPLPEGFEEIETVTPVDVLRRAGHRVTLAALGANLLVAGRNGIALVVGSEKLNGFQLSKMNIFPNIYETRWIDLKPESPLDRPEEIVKLRIPIAIGIAKHCRTGFLGNAFPNSEESHEKSSDLIGSPRFPKL